MKWLLVLSLHYSGQPTAVAPVGLLIDQPTCTVAGAGMTMLVERANPGLDVAWTCLPVDEGAGV
jgi:hypothetical protein